MDGPDELADDDESAAAGPQLPGLPVEVADRRHVILDDLAHRVAPCKAAVEDLRKQIIDSNKLPARDKDRLRLVLIFN